MRYNICSPKSVVREFFCKSKHLLFFLEVLSRKRIGLTSMAEVYVVLGVGLILSFLVLIAEIIWKRKEKLKTTRLVAI